MVYQDLQCFDDFEWKLLSDEEIHKKIKKVTILLTSHGCYPQGRGYLIEGLLKLSA